MPADGGDCDPGCTCTLRFDVDDGGEVVPDYSCLVAYDETCPDGRHIACSAIDDSSDLAMVCLWWAGTVPIDVDPFGDCNYNARLVHAM
jgi:hypothetical protein